jgi:hypothetical protein
MKLILTRLIQYVYVIHLDARMNRNYISFEHVFTYHVNRYFTEILLEARQLSYHSEFKMLFCILN